MLEEREEEQTGNTQEVAYTTSCYSPSWGPGHETGSERKSDMKVGFIVGLFTLDSIDMIRFRRKRKTRVQKPTHMKSHDLSVNIHVRVCSVSAS